MGEERQWTGTTYGTGGMHRWLITLLRYLDVRALYAFALVFVVPVCLFLPGSGVIYRFLRRRMGYGTLRAAGLTYVNLCQFAQVVIDRFAMYAGRHFDIEVEGRDHFLRLSRRPEGFVMMSSHAGNYELAGYTLLSEQKTLNALVYFGEKQSVMDNRTRMFGHTHVRMIAIREDMSHLFDINNALAAGEIVSIPADRRLGSQKTFDKLFLGGVARFPQGPFRLAVMRGAEVLAVNVMKVSWHRYRVYVTPLAYSRQASRREQLEQLSTAYVAELERIVRRYPTQWYNYFEFWT